MSDTHDPDAAPTPHLDAPPAPTRGDGVGPGDAARIARLRAEIAERVEQLYALEHRVPEFEPGTTAIPYSGRVFDHTEIVSVVDAALDAWITAGPRATEFERGLARFTGARGAVFVNSGSSANLLALLACTSPRVERPLLPGDEVITPAASFPTTVNPILQAGCTPVFVDVELGTYNPTPETIEAAIGPRTRGIMLAHTLGNPFDASALRALADAHGLFLIEDACDALGATWDGKNVGTFGDLGTLSFYPAHQLTTGEGGAVLYRDPKQRVVLESFRDWGRDCWCEPGHDDTCGKRFAWKLGALPEGYDHKYVYSHIGYNLKATDLQAALGLAQLRKLPAFVARRRHNFDRLRAALAPHEDVLLLPRSSPRAEPSWFGFPITVREGAPFTKNEIVRHLESRKVATRSLFGGNLLRQPAWEGKPHRVSGGLANSDVVMSSTFLVGVYPGIDDPRLDHVMATFAEFLERRRLPRHRGSTP